MKILQSNLGRTGLLILAIIAMVAILADGRLFEKLDISATLFGQTVDSVFTASSEHVKSEGPPTEGGAPQKPLWNTDWSGALNILATLLLTSVLSGLISYRSGGGKAQKDFTEAHIVLSVSAALMMMIIGSQIARAFGLMGAASIVRYRYSLKSPKEASSLVIALGVGMACGVGLYPLAIIVTLYIVAMIFIFEHLPKGIKRSLFSTNWNWNLRVRTINPDATILLIKDLLDDDDIVYEIKRVRSERGPEKDQTEIEVEISGIIDKNHLAEELNIPDILRIVWKREKTSGTDDWDIEQ